MESNIKVRDSLNFAKDKSLVKLIGDEELLFIDKLIKINRYNYSQ